MFRSIVPLSSCLVVLLAAGCVRYRAQAVGVAAAADALPRAPAGPLSFEEATRLLVARNPQLRAARADIGAVNVDPGPAPLSASQQVRDGRATEALLASDVLSLLGIGPRAAERALARAVRDERVRRHHELARDLVARLAEAYAVEHELRRLSAPGLPLDVDAFEAAGLASRSTVAAARSVVAEGEAEGQVLAAQLADARREIAQLIGAGPQATIDPVEVEAGWPALAEPERQRLVLARGDLQRLLGAWCVADRRYRLAIARQLPNLVVGLGADVDLELPMQLVRLELPLDAPAEARAAERGRDAAFHRLEAGVLDALHEAESARLDLVAAGARLRGAAERQRASRALLEAERARVETDPDALAAAVLIAGRAVDAARQVRESAVAAARARVRAARAAGWPTPEVLGGER